MSRSESDPAPRVNWQAGAAPATYSVDTLADREAIRHVLALYYRGLDRLDYDLVRAAYHPDAHDSHHRYDGDIDGFIEYVRKSLARFIATHHHMGNQIIVVDGDVAHAETNVIAHHRTIPTDDEPPKDITVWLRYVDRLERRNGEWKIADRVCVHDYGRVDPVTDPHEFAADAVMSRRDRLDPVYTWSR